MAWPILLMDKLLACRCVGLDTTFHFTLFRRVKNTVLN
jgi:hypothetical protein